MNEIKNGVFMNDDEFFKSVKITEGGNLIKAQRMGHKYIKRTGVPGNYKYWYRTASGAIIEGKAPKVEEKINEIQNNINKLEDKISNDSKYDKKTEQKIENLRVEKDKLIGQRIIEEKTILQKDTEAAEKIKVDIGDAFKKISDTIKKIDNDLSEFNSPGLRAAFVESIKKALTSQGFNDTVAINELMKYFSRK